MRNAGKYTHIHIDGDFKPLLKYFPGLPFDGFESLTPQPQGDTTLDEMKEYISDKVLLDGIPAILFTSTYSVDQLMDCVGKIVELFHPRLVLGISDEIPEGVDENELNKVKIVSDYCKKKTI